MFLVTQKRGNTWKQHFSSQTPKSLPPMRKRSPATYCIRPRSQQHPSTPIIHPKRMMATAMPMKPAVILRRSAVGKTEKQHAWERSFIKVLIQNATKMLSVQCLLAQDGSHKEGPEGGQSIDSYSSLSWGEGAGDHTDKTRDSPWFWFHVWFWDRHWAPLGCSSPCVRWGLAPCHPAVLSVNLENFKMVRHTVLCCQRHEILCRLMTGAQGTLLPSLVSRWWPC